MAELHPMLRVRGVVFQLPPLVEFVEEFGEQMYGGELSLVCTGRFRYGKTTARKFLVDAVTANKSMVAASALVSEDDHDKESRNRIWRDLMRGNDPQANVLTSNPYDTLQKMLLVQADVFGTKRVLIILDEAQNVTGAKLARLKKLIEELTDQGLSPFVLLIGPPALRDLPAKLLKQGYADVVDRFFTQFTLLRGLEHSEVPDALSFYDTTTWQEKTYTEYFLPILWKEGWRLENQARQFQEAFWELNERLKTGNQEIGIKYLTTAARKFFIALQKDPGAQSPEQLKRLRNSVFKCGLAESMMTVGKAPTKT
jgi:hypothetical protein